MRYLYVLIGLALLLSLTSAEAGSFSPTVDVSTYVDTAKANESFSGSNILWVSSVDGIPAKETYLSFVNDFVTNSASKPDRIQSATLKLYANNVDKPGKLTAYFVQGPTLETTTWTDKPDFDAATSANLTIEKPGVYFVDVTPIIKKAVEKCLECGYSIVLVADDKHLDRALKYSIPKGVINLFNGRLSITVY